MPKRQQEYKKALEHLIDSLKRADPKEQDEKKSESSFMQAVEDMAKDEWSLIATYLKSDLKSFGQEFKKAQETEKQTDDPFIELTKESIWEGLAEITDKTQLEWMEVFQDFEHKGVYEVDDVIGLGVLVCDKCQHKRTYNHASIVESCIKCGNGTFKRESLNP